MEAENERLKNEIEKLKTSNASLSSTNESLQSEVKSLKSKLSLPSTDANRHPDTATFWTCSFVFGHSEKS